MCIRPAQDRTGCAAKAPRKRKRRAVDGRTTPARRYASIVAAFTAEIGGDLTAAESALVEQAAMLQLRVEQLRADIIAGRPVDDDLLIRLASTARRALSQITAKAKPATGETFPQYMARKAAELQSDDDDHEDDT
jgi:hypothetical protein